MYYVLLLICVFLLCFVCIVIMDCGFHYWPISTFSTLTNLLLTENTGNKRKNVNTFLATYDDTVSDMYFHDTNTSNLVNMNKALFVQL